MYEMFRRWILSIVGISMLLALVDLLLPDGGMRRFARMAAGLVAVAVIVQPLMQLVGSKPLDMTRVWDKLYAASSTRTEEVKPGMEDQTLTLFRDKLLLKIDEDVKPSGFTAIELTLQSDQAKEDYLGVSQLVLKRSTSGKTEGRISVGRIRNGASNPKDQPDRLEKQVLDLLQNKYGITNTKVRIER